MNNHQAAEQLVKFDLLDILGLDFPLKERAVYYQELLQLFLFNFLLDSISSADDETTQVLQRELNSKKQPDEILETLQELHPDFMVKFVDFVESQKRLFVLNFLEGVKNNLERKKEKLVDSRIFDKKIEKYRLAFLAAQAEDWVSLKSILNPKSKLDSTLQS